MRKLALSSAISTISAFIATPAFAASMTCGVAGGASNGTLYTTVATSAGISVVDGPLTSTDVYYPNTNGTASVPNDKPNATLTVSGDWCIDKTTGDFTGNIAYGSYKTQTDVTGLITIDGRQTFTGVNQAFSGKGAWTGSGSLTLHYLLSPGTVNAGGASTWSGSASCVNGATSPLGKVCASVTASKDWEGLAFDFVFNNSTKYSFIGALTGTDTSGTGLSANTTSINWNVVGIDPPAVPTPAAAWLFGSGLIGLAGAARRRSK